MPQLKPPYQYVIDSSALFDMYKLYPESVFPGIWDRFNEMCDQELIIAPREVLREIKNGNDDLVVWAEDHEDIFKTPCDEELVLNHQIIAIYPPHIVAKNSTRPWADPLVLACAKHFGLSIIQHETNDPNQYKIPPMARKLNVQYLNLVQFFSEVGWVFN